MAGGLVGQDLSLKKSCVSRHAGVNFWLIFMGWVLYAFRRSGSSEIETKYPRLEMFQIYCHF